jgi:hypothetical protein
MRHSRRVLLFVSLLIVSSLLSGSAVLDAATVAAVRLAPQTATVTFGAASQSSQSFVVPALVTSLQFEIVGASGGGRGGGRGASVTGTMMVTPGQTFQVWVGLMGGSGTPGGTAPGGGWGGRGGLRLGGNGGQSDLSNYSGSGGGGATEVDVVSAAGPAATLVVAGGGGGAAAYAATADCGAPGTGGCGATVLGLGVDGSAGSGAAPTGGGGIGAGTAGGSGGNPAPGFTGGTAGEASDGGAGGSGGGGSTTPTVGGGGGGGGYGGGGGGGSAIAFSGGGGSGRSLFVGGSVNAAVGSVNYGVASGIGDGSVTFSFPASPPAGASAFVPVRQVRLLDTRSTADLTAGKPLDAGSSIDLAVAGRRGVPAAGVSAVVLNVTAAEARGPGFVTVWPGSLARPTASNLNVTAAGQNLADLVTVKLGPTGAVSIFSQSGSHIVVDLEGYYESVSAQVSSGRYRTLSPSRILDTRTGTGVPVAGVVPGGGVVDVAIAGRGGVPVSGASAVALNVTAAEALAPGYVTVWPTGQDRPSASSLNATSVGQNIANLVIVPLGTDGRVSFFSQSGTQLVADVAGWFTDESQPADISGLFVPIDPARVLDTRAALGVRTKTAVVANGSISLPVAGRGGVPAGGVSAIVVNVTAVQALAPGFVTVWPDSAAQPLASNLNVTFAGQNIANLTSVGLGPTGAISIYTQSGAHLVADLAGYYIS